MKTLLFFTALSTLSITSIVAQENPKEKNQPTAELKVRNCYSTKAPDSNPLLIIDGVFTPYDTLSSVIHPEQIESITVLKNETAIALCGSSGAAGVILITTKQSKSKEETTSNIPASSLTVYPNPTQKEFNIKSDQPIENVILIRENGTLSATYEGKGVSVFTQNIESLERGVYILFVKTKDGIEKHRLLKQ
ncbi:T9SS type A sorting domain-containing protein [Algivirga pacifica]|uniref:Secretion system C-terminal sorting domain-containing protein n=1 Tax=Algivirga pacifica TaxID=1162670 RepID=A0ABP9DD09_9BACT